VQGYFVSFVEKECNSLLSLDPDAALVLFYNSRGARGCVYQILQFDM
jgi:hypothetical protein